MTMYKLFDALSVFDWITPTIGFVETFWNDPTPLQSNSWTFFVPYDESLSSGWNAVDIEKLLNQHGIKTWGGQITNGEFFVSVKLEQAQWAEYLILRHRIPLNERFIGAPAPKRVETPSAHLQAKKQEKPQKPGGDIFSTIENFLDEWLP